MPDINDIGDAIAKLVKICLEIFDYLFHNSGQDWSSAVGRGYFSYIKNIAKTHSALRVHGTRKTFFNSSVLQEKLK